MCSRWRGKVRHPQVHIHTHMCPHVDASNLFTTWRTHEALSLLCVYHSSTSSFPPDLALNTKFRPSIVAAGAIVVAVDVVRSVASKPCNYEMSASSGQKAVLLETMRELLVDGISLRPFTRQQKHQQMSDENNLDACIARLKRRIFNAESEVAGRAQDTQAGVSETTHRLPPSPVTTRMPTLRSLPAMRGGGRGGAAAAAAGRGGKGRGGKREEGGAVVPETSYNQVAFSQGFVSEAASGARPAASPMSAVKP